jgi:hypothetical protein
MSLPEKLYFMPADAEDEPGIELGDGRVLLVHPYNLDDGNDEDDDYVSKLYRAIVHRYNNYNKVAKKADFASLVIPLLKVLERQNPEGFISLMTAVFKEREGTDCED